MRITVMYTKTQRICARTCNVFPLFIKFGGTQEGPPLDPHPDLASLLPVTEGKIIQRYFIPIKKRFPPIVSSKHAPVFPALSPGTDKNDMDAWDYLELESFNFDKPLT